MNWIPFTLMLFPVGMLLYLGLGPILMVLLTGDEFWKDPSTRPFVLIFGGLSLILGVWGGVILYGEYLRLTS